MQELTSETQPHLNKWSTEKNCDINMNGVTKIDEISRLCRLMRINV